MKRVDDVALYLACGCLALAVTLVKLRTLSTWISTQCLFSKLLTVFASVCSTDSTRIVCKGWTRALFFCPETGSRMRPSARPSEIALNFGTPPGGNSPRTSSDFEEISYPSLSTSPNIQHNHITNTWSTRQEELPLHHMNEDTARRRFAGRPPPLNGTSVGEEEEYSEKYEGYGRPAAPAYDDGGKDVYNKIHAAKSPLGSGKLRRPPPPPPTTIVRPFIVTPQICLKVFPYS